MELVETMKDCVIADLVLKKQTDLINMILKKENEISELKVAEQKMSTQRKYMENQLSNFKEKVKGILEENGIEKIETEVGKIQVRLNPISVEVEDIEKVPDEYKTIKIVVNVDKKKVADNFKETGELIDGVKINLGNTRLEIK